MEILVETFYNPGEPSSNPIRVRPFPGQKFSSHFRVSCSVSMRESKSVGSLFRVNVSLVHQPDADPYLKIRNDEVWVSIDEKDAREFILRSTP